MTKTAKAATTQPTAYKVEILTATKTGLAAFLRELKRTKYRHQYPDGCLAFQHAQAAVRKKRQPVLSYSAFIDQAVTAWEESEHARVAAAHAEDQAEAQKAERDAAASGDFHKKLAALDTGGSYRDALKARRDREIHAIKDYLGTLNRDLNDTRIDTYARAMEKAEWWFTPDPIVVTDEGAIINGQHRLLAAEGVLFGNRTVKESTPLGSYDRKMDPWPDANAPQFVVVWGVDKRAAILMDEARRTATDRRDIAIRFARSA